MRTALRRAGRALQLALALLAGATAFAQPLDDAVLQVELGTHGGAVRRVAADAARGWVVTGSDDKSARVWALADGEPGRILRPPAAAGEGGRVYGVALHPSRPWVAVGGSSAALAAAPSRHAIHVFDLRSGDVVQRLDARAGDVKRLLWSTDGALLFAGYAGTHGVRAFAADGREVFADGFAGGVYALAVAPGLLAAAGLDGSLRIYTVDGGAVRERQRVTLAPGPVSLAFAPDASALAVGHFVPGKAPDLVDLRSGRVDAIAAPARLGRSTLLAVAWSADGRRLFAAGSYGYAERNARILELDVATRRMREVETGARSTITDLAPIADGRVAFAVADGAWGVLAADAASAAVHRSLLPDLAGAANLRVGSDARRLSWTLKAGSGRIGFDLERRTLDDGNAADLAPPRLRRGLIDGPSDWENRRDPRVNGERIALGADEESRAVALFEQERDAVLGTSRAVYRIGPRGEVRWRAALHTEARAVHVGRDGRLVVAALLDGTLRLLRASDGRELLALLVLDDGRWVVWSPAGYFDASVGADRLIGWVVNRRDGSATDHHPLARLRTRFHQPRYIDHVLDTLDDAQAGARWRAEAGADAVAAPARVDELPPTLSSPTASVTLPAGSAPTALEMPVVVHSRADPASLAFELRIDGRPGRLSVLRLNPADGGRSIGALRLEVPAGAASVQVLARDRNGYSEPLLLAVQRVAAAVRPSRLPRLFVLAIGVSEYQRPDYRLGLPAKDAADFARAIARQQGRLYADVTTRVLLDAQARRADVQAGLRWLAEAGGRDDVVMLFIAGHGVNAGNGRYYFLPHDARHEALAATAVAEDDIRQALRGVPGRAILFIDTCHAGNVLGAAGRGQRELARFVNDLASAENGVVVFASSAGRQVSEEDSAWGNGAFTRVLLQGLAGQADLVGSGQVTYKGLDYFLSEGVKRLTAGRQTPVSLSPWGLPDFVLAAN